MNVYCFHTITKLTIGTQNHRKLESTREATLSYPWHPDVSPHESLPMWFSLPKGQADVMQLKDPTS
jgi:hypothetical protein